MMGQYQITHVRVSDDNATSVEKITHVQLNDGTPFTVSQIVKFIDKGHDFFYTHGYFLSKALVEAVHPTNRDPYIRTKANSTTNDNLLNLPRF